MKKLILFVFVLSLFIEISTAKIGEDCFNAFNKYSTSDRQRFYYISLEETLNTTLTLNVFKCFLKASRYGDEEKVATEKYLDIYEMCRKYKFNLPDPFGSKQMNELKRLGLNSELISYLNDGVISGNKQYIDESISYIEDLMKNYIEGSDEYKSYRKSILRKVVKSQNVENREEHIVRAAAFDRRSGQKCNKVDKSVYQLSQFLCLLLTIYFSF